MRKIIFILTVSLVRFVTEAQDATYNHDEAVMNQFLVGETGAGGLTPSWYYDGAHRDYQKYAAALNKSGLRGKVLLDFVKEVLAAEKIDSSFTERAVEEAFNIADRTPGVGDISWWTESSKISTKMTALRKNIDKIVIVGGTLKEKEYYEMYYKCFESAIGNLRDSYNPSSGRKDEYLNIYKDICTVNDRVVKLLVCYLAIEGGKKHKQRHDIVQPDISRIATSAHGRWKLALADVVGKR